MHQTGGAFYLFVKSPVADEKKFCNAAKKHNILLVPGSSFGCPGYVRMAYCVAYETIEIPFRNSKNLRKSINKAEPAGLWQELYKVRT